MTDDRMALQALLEKTPDADYLRQMIGFAAQRLMELDIESRTGAAHGERSADRLVSATATATATGRRAPGWWSYAFQGERAAFVRPSCARAAISRASSSRADG